MFGYLLGSTTDQFYVYRRTFLWDAMLQRWTVQTAKGFWQTSNLYKFEMACEEIGNFPGTCAPPYFVGEKWFFSNGKWELVQRESNWPQGPHTCFSPNC